MKTLSQQEILEVLNREKTPSISDEHLDAVRHEERLRLHSETRLRLFGSQWRALNEFLAILPQKILPKDKYEKFANLLTLPLPTVEVTDQAYNELFKVFFGQNRVTAFRFDENHEELNQDWEEYMSKNHFHEWFMKEGWNVFKNHINAPVVIDLHCSLVV